jgi:putative transposase
MKGHSDKFPIKKMASILKISRSRYYRWLKCPTSNRRRRDMELVEIIKQIHKDNREVYGRPKIHDELIRKGVTCSKNRLGRLMSENGIRARQKRKYKATTDSGHALPVAPNIVNREFVVDTPNKVWASDLTYVWTMEGWLYLCIILDLYSRKIVGWAMGPRITTDLVTDSLSMAYGQRKPADGLIFHSDRGVQYASYAFRELLDKYQMIQSMSRKGNCWDNACAESFFATLKNEEVYFRTYKTREEARISIFEYIAVFYNRKRRHSFLDYLSPEEFELKKCRYGCAA